MNTPEHWQRVYETKSPNEVSWYAPHLPQSLRLIQEVATQEARIIDVGAGASTLVDDLLDLGYRNITALDIANEALEIARRRLGKRGDHVTWLTADITTAALAQSSFDLWHDRAVFHFFTDENDRHAYVRQVQQSVVAGGHVVLATFSLDGPTKCSGLDVMRYDAPSLTREFGPSFQLNAEIHATHTTPSNKEQRFICCRFIKLS
jgi:2-polyprenyl-3-methyl-5-hydroxy-6-metoxy-1,4-benzoquinol methylase